MPSEVSEDESSLSSAASVGTRHGNGTSAMKLLVDSHGLAGAIGGIAVLEKPLRGDVIAG